MYNNIAFWTPVAIVEMSHYAAFTNCKEKKPHRSYTSLHIYVSKRSKYTQTSQSLSETELSNFFNSGKQKLSAVFIVHVL